MRLTLRTLLAFMDEILDPADREELAKKVEASDFANDLIHRTKDTMRRLRLSAPHVVGTGIGLDPNTVAEYLDNALPPESVADFERICLESDVHLAEVASCHHVLTMVLGEPADVEPAARQRMYSIPADLQRRKQVRMEPAHPVPPLGPVLETVPPPIARVFPPRGNVPAASAAPRAARASTDIPDYLRASAWDRLRVFSLVGLAAILLVAVTVFLLSGLRGWMGGQPDLVANTTRTAPADAQPSTAADPAATTSPETIAVPEPSSSQSSAGNESSGAARSADGSASKLSIPPANPNSAPIEQSPPPLLTPGIGASSTTPSDASRTGVLATATPPTAEPTNVAVDSYRVTGPNLGGVAPTTGNLSAGESPAAAPGPNQLATTGSMPVDDGNIDTSAGRVSGAEQIPDERLGSAPVDGLTLPETVAVAAERAPAAVADLGTYLDGKTVLLHYDPAAAAWFRVTPRGTIHEGDKLLAVPAFYPKISLVAGIHLKLAGGTNVSFAVALAGTAGDASGGARDVPLIDVAFGKVVLVNTAGGDNVIQLKVGSNVSTIRLVQNATLAVEVIPKYVPGRDPRQSPSPIELFVYVRDGSVVWSDANGSQSIASPGHWSITDGIASAVSADADFPKWIDEEPIDPPTDQRYAAPAIDKALDPTRSVQEQLLELYQTSRQREVKSLVARSSVYVGQFVPFIEALRDSEQKGTWKTQIETLRSAMALGPESADQIWQTLVEQRGDAAAHDLYEMLCGYDQDQIGHTAQQIAAGPVSRLIDRLEDDSIDYRVLAAQNLLEITGKQLMRNPAGTPAELAKGVRLWRERLKSGELLSGTR